jgi:hypothetical protein
LGLHLSTYPTTQHPYLPETLSIAYALMNRTFFSDGVRAR